MKYAFYLSFVWMGLLTLCHIPLFLKNSLLNNFYLHYHWLMILLSPVLYLLLLISSRKQVFGWVLLMSSICLLTFDSNFRELKNRHIVEYNQTKPASEFECPYLGYKLTKSTDVNRPSSLSDYDAAFLYDIRMFTYSALIYKKGEGTKSQRVFPDASVSAIYNADWYLFHHQD